MLDAANRVVRCRLEVEASDRHDRQPSDVLYRDVLLLRAVAKWFDSFPARCGAHKRPDAFFIEVTKTEVLREVSDTWTGILDVMRFNVASHA